MTAAQISISDYTYHLPEERIALHPLEQRDASKLLIYKAGAILESNFADISQHLPPKSLLVINNTKVINARIRFKKATGASIEIFCLEPLADITDYNTVMSTTHESTWKCLVGGAAKWKNELLERHTIIQGQRVVLQAEMLEKLKEAYSIKLSWTPAHYSFAEIIEASGDTPLPPYIKRDTGEEDVSRYQTIFAKAEGSVAAPTAGLHFTENIFKKLAEKNIEKAYVTLHVGAGTFKPVKAAIMQEHEMHAEYIDVNIETIEQLKNSAGNITAVGTTSCRTIESLYWLGVKVSIDPFQQNISIRQWDVYQEPLINTVLTPIEALQALINWMRTHNKTSIFTQTQLMIAPGYQFRLTNTLVTNFHQPQSTLLLLVAAAIGEDWRKMYDHALKHDFRFLSYGDGNLIFIDSKKKEPGKALYP
ncbi:MAG: S-adenosylmethionine:tRNA ribosyltransferase-isomerase [Chitinophagaceae bacterium]|nr:MAG: S-adenosylmethionine:tRNA ribosyltransferase-isomerase [Chitinophagaceae bacterium]